MILDTSLAGIGACPGPTRKALSKEGEKTGASEPENALFTWVAITGEVNVATGWDELERVMAGTEGNEETNTGTLNVPNEAARELATTIAGPELQMAITGGTLDTEALFSRTAEMMTGSEFSRAWAVAFAISLEREVADTEEVAVTTTGAAEDDGAEEDELRIGQPTSCRRLNVVGTCLRQETRISQVEKGPLTTRPRKAMDRKNANQPHNR